jgi:hypothetical protein
VEQVRAWALIRLRDSSLRALQAEMDIAKSSVDKFVKRQALPGKIWPKLRHWYLHDPHRRACPSDRDADMALLVLESLADLPGERLPDALVAVAAFYEELHRRARAPVPAWTQSLRDLARDGALTARRAALDEYPAPKKRGRKRKAPDPET